MISLDFQLHCTGIWTSTTKIAELKNHPMTPADHILVMHPVWGLMAERYQMHFTWHPKDGERDWTTIAVHLTWDNMNLYTKPLAVYTGAVDEWWSGMAHYDAPMTQADRKWIRNEAPSATEYHQPAPVSLTLSARRSA